MKRCVLKVLALFAAAVLLAGAASNAAYAHSGHPGKGRRTIATIARPAVYRESVSLNGYGCVNAPCPQEVVCPVGNDCADAPCYQNGVCAQNGACDADGVCRNGGICEGAPCLQDGVCPVGNDCADAPCPQDGTGYGLHHSESHAGYSSGNYSQRGHRSGHH